MSKLVLGQSSQRIFVNFELEIHPLIMRNTLLAILAILASYTGFSQEFTKTDIPSITIKDLEGKPFSTSSITNDGKPVIVDFWATWCKPCVASLNGMNEVYAEWQEETGVKIYAVSIDDTRTMSSVAPFVAGKGWGFDVLLDANSDFRRAMNVNNVPHTFLLDGNGKIVLQRNTYTPGDEELMREALGKLTNK